MIVLVLLALVVLAVPLLGGRLSRLADLRLRALPALWASLVLQVLVIEVLPDVVPHDVAAGLHLVSYGLAGLFLLRNLDVPGMAVVAVGGGLNAAAILANGGVMPATARAVRVAGLELGDEFSNSDVSSGSPLWWLGDVFAVPASWPFSNVFSIGDVVLLLGAVALVHGLSGTVLGRLFGVELVAAAAPAADVDRHPDADPHPDAGAAADADAEQDAAATSDAGPAVPRLSLVPPPAAPLDGPVGSPSDGPSDSTSGGARPVAVPHA